MLEILFAGIVFALSGVMLKNLGWRGAPVFAALSLVVLLSSLPSRIEGALAVSELAFAGEAGAAISKIVGIGYLFGICSEICRELGESSVATGLVIAGRLEMLGVCMPYLIRLAEDAVGAVGGL